MSSQNLRAVSLRRVLPATSFVGCADIPVFSVTDDSRRCRPGSLFAVVRGHQRDGAGFVTDALANGATALLTEAPIVGVTLPQCIVPNVRAAYSQLCLTLARNPDRAVEVTGVTGTNGKTTVTWLLRSIFEFAGKTTGTVGTVEYRVGDDSRPASLTTPDPATFASLLRDMANADTSHAFVELSSHALDQSRLGGLRLASAVVTNVTQDHFDYHGDFAGYLRAKSGIANYCGSTTPIVINTDDQGCQSLMSMWIDRPVVRFGLNPGTESRGLILDMQPKHTTVRFEILGQSFDANIALPGRHNVSNCVAAATVAVLAGLTADKIVRGLERVAFVPGRLQPIDLGQSFRVFIDYAHTPDALRQVISALRPTTSGKIICVFGAGGDRDALKRPLLGNAAATADLAVVTSDNPRSERPMSIIDQVCEGIGTTKHYIEPDRKAAIDRAIREATDGDCVLIAGKGHETTQHVGSEVLPFDDRLVAGESIVQACYSPTDIVPSTRVISWMR